jgi:hypothetical protein
MAKVLTLDIVKLHLKLTDRQTHLDDEIEQLRIPGAESAAEDYLGGGLEGLALDSGSEEPFAVAGHVQTALLYLLEADMERDPKTQELYIKRAHNLLFNSRFNVGV